jgi:hypothetical protein
MKNVCNGAVSMMRIGVRWSLKFRRQTGKVRDT